MMVVEGSWYYSVDHNQPCQVIDAQTLWGQTTCRVWLPGRDSVVRITASRLKPLNITLHTADWIGLSAVRNHRLAQLAAEERVWRAQLDQRVETTPELFPLLLLRVEGRGGPG